MNETIKQQLTNCIRLHMDGKLKEGDLQQVMDSIEDGACQNILYIQASTTSLGSPAQGISMIIDGQVQDIPVDPKEWPYQSALEAIRDGWRVISFPDLSLLMDETNPRGLGCEFILENWSND